MKNKFFPDEDITENDLYFMCYIVERVARELHQRNKYVVNKIGYEELEKKISVANVLHCENPLKIVDEWIRDYNLEHGDFDITDVDRDLAEIIPTPTQMGKVYTRLILQTLDSNEDYVQGMIRVYNHPICEKIDNYNCSAFYEPSYVITRAYLEGDF